MFFQSMEHGPMHKEFMTAYAASYDTAFIGFYEMFGDSGAYGVAPGDYCKTKMKGVYTRLENPDAPNCPYCHFYKGELEYPVSNFHPTLDEMDVLYVCEDCGQEYEKLVSAAKREAIDAATHRFLERCGV